MSDLAPESRARHLREPWGAVRNGLDHARTATYIAVPICALLLCAVFIIAPLVQHSRGDRELVKYGSWVLAALQVFPLIIHTVAQIICTRAPVSYGGQLAASSAWLLGLSAIFLAALLMSDLPLYAALLGGGLMLASFSAWLRFLARLGQRLDDREMMAASWSYNSWFWIGFALSVFLLLCSTAFVSDPDAAPIRWMLQVAPGVMALLLLVSYGSLLRTASLAIARRGPVRPKG